MTERGTQGYVPRDEAERMLSTSLKPIAAIALAAEEAARAMSRTRFSRQGDGRYVSKTMGLDIAVLWTEGVREWILAESPLGVRLFTPHDWTELVVRDLLHVRIERERGRAVSARQQSFKDQHQDPLLPDGMLKSMYSAERRITNILITARKTAGGRISDVEASAPLGEKSGLWRPIAADMAEARLLLDSWRADGAPWLSVVGRTEELAGFDALRQERDRLSDDLDRLRFRYRDIGPVVPLADEGADDEGPSWTNRKDDDEQASS